MQHNRAFYIINSITLYRLLAAPFLLVFVIAENLEVFRWLLLISFATDAIDGFLSRRAGVASVFGSRLDSIADDSTIIVAIIAILIFRMDFFLDALMPVLLLIFLFLIQTSMALIRYGKITSFHTYGAKIAAVLQGIFLILLFFLPRPLYPLFYAAVVITSLELIEEIILVMILPVWQNNVKGLFWVLKSRSRKIS